MKSEDVPFVGGPLDGRVLSVLTGMTGNPPKVYEVPVPGADGEKPTTLVYRRVPVAHTRRVGLTQGWQYEYDPEGKPSGGPKWPWTKPQRDASP
ncbi:hypothetical protein [Streptomyces apocyni]|uniref:hypothetical protein n=1 Tax=Streptomyces apocyni TaxID=2654677 RepID=UPI0018D12F44|nr:hypothetical protein [Streptomyces apocyni]